MFPSTLPQVPHTPDTPPSLPRTPQPGLRTPQNRSVREHNREYTAVPTRDRDYATRDYRDSRDSYATNTRDNYPNRDSRDVYVTRESARDVYPNRDQRSERDYQSRDSRDYQLAPRTPQSLPRTPSHSRPQSAAGGTFPGVGQRPLQGPLPRPGLNNHPRMQKKKKSSFWSNFCTHIMVTSLDDLRSKVFWRACFAEMIGTLLLTMFGCGSVTNWDAAHPSTVQISLAFGLGVATLVWCLAHASGGHINPAVSFSLLVTKKISLARAGLYILFQCVGAMIGAGILKGVTPSHVRSNLGATTVAGSLTAGQGFAIEMFVTFVLILTVFATLDSHREDLKGSGPLAIGLAVCLCHLFAVKYTGCGMNPARSFGPAVAMGVWKDHWIYWIGPLFGAAVAGILYENLFAATASISRAKGYLLTSDGGMNNIPRGPSIDRALSTTSPGSQTPDIEVVEEKTTSI